MYALLLSIIFMVLLAPVGFTQSQFNSQIPQSADDPVNYPTAANANNAALIRTLFNYRQGVFLTYNNASSLNAGAGEIACNSNTGATNGETVVYRQNTSTTSVTTANLDTGNSFNASTTYYIYADCDASAATFTIVVSLNASTPSGVTNYKLLGSFTTDSSSNISNIIDNSVVARLSNTWASFSTGTAYQAHTDVFIVCYGTPSGTNQYVLLYDDINPSPATLITSCGSGSNISLQASCGIPVAKGEYYKAVVVGGTGFTCFQRAWGQ